ncbi:MAG: CCXG family PEP-CTERM protein [Thiotrichaceae bacterium]
MHLRIKKTFLGLILLSIGIYSSTANAWIDCYWSYRSDVSITEQSGTPLTDYQVELSLDVSSFHSNYNWSSNGDDLRLIDTDDSTQLDFFIKSWDSVAQTATLWVKMSLTASQTKTIYLYYGNTDASSASNAGVTFTETGIKFHTRYSTANPTNKSDAFSSFNAAADGVAGYGCSIITNFTNISNHAVYAPPSVNMNFGAYSETFFEVSVAEAGLWEFRYGADFGRGGGLYVDGVALDEKWNTDLWWAYNWNNTTEILQGSISLTSGYHTLEVIGFEGCCDGGITVQFKKPGDAFKSYSDANINVNSRKCPVAEPAIAYSNAVVEVPSIVITKTSTVLSDPVQGITNPKRIPGAIVRYLVSVSNTGSAADRDTININDPIPANVKLMVTAGHIGFSDGSPASGLNFSYDPLNPASDDITFSDDNGASFLYIPVADAEDADSDVTQINLQPAGRLGCSNTGAAYEFSLFYDVIIE